MVHLSRAKVLCCTEPREGHFLSDIETRKLERKSKQKISRLNDLLYRFNKSLNRYEIEWKLKQENQNGH